MKKGTPVLVTTSHRGVFFGYLERHDEDKKIVSIKQARMAVYWSADVRGVIGLAANGPSAGCRIGPPAPSLVLHDVTSVAEVSAEAVKKWEESKWSK